MLILKLNIGRNSTLSGFNFTLFWDHLNKTKKWTKVCQRKLVVEIPTAGKSVKRREVRLRAQRQALHNGTVKGRVHCICFQKLIQDYTITVQERSVLKYKSICTTSLVFQPNFCTTGYKKQFSKSLTEVSLRELKIYNSCSAWCREQNGPESTIVQS